jgi:hypothetical protein
MSTDTDIEMERDRETDNNTDPLKRKNASKF